jgi:hypothetical protein
MWERLHLLLQRLMGVQAILEQQRMDLLLMGMYAEAQASDGRTESEEA